MPTAFKIFEVYRKRHSGHGDWPGAGDRRNALADRIDFVLLKQLPVDGLNIPIEFGHVPPHSQRKSTLYGKLVGTPVRIQTLAVSARAASIAGARD
jgi:hypothetical protein